LLEISKSRHVVTVKSLLIANKKTSDTFSDAPKDTGHLCCNQLQTSPILYCIESHLLLIG